MNFDSRLEVVSGYLQLEMPEDAMEELDLVPMSCRGDEGYQELLLAAQMMEKRWNAASETARLLCKKQPRRKHYFIHAAYCLHETGDTLAAKTWLMRGPKTLFKDALFHYNMGCYSAVLGEKESALGYLKKAFDLDESLREVAEKDSDLVGVV